MLDGIAGLKRYAAERVRGGHGLVAEPSGPGWIGLHCCLVVGNRGLQFDYVGMVEFEGFANLRLLVRVLKGNRRRSGMNSGRASTLHVGDVKRFRQLLPQSLVVCPE